VADSDANHPINDLFVSHLVGLQHPIRNFKRVFLPSGQKFLSGLEGIDRGRASACQSGAAFRIGDDPGGFIVFQPGIDKGRSLVLQEGAPKRVLRTGQKPLLAEQRIDPHEGSVVAHAVNLISAFQIVGHCVKQAVQRVNKGLSVCGNRA